MKQKQKFAIDGFYTGCNCAQSVITAYANEFDMDTGMMLRVASAFGGGMGRTQQTCGAVTGAYMLLGLHGSKLYTDDAEAKVKTPLLVQQFHKKFEEINGSVQCSDLIKIDLKTDEGQEQFKREEMKEKICCKCINSSIEILESLLSKQ
nr:C-GCAxxG-C-C family protein [uncultured Carboxylicivirga sp.]